MKKIKILILLTATVFALCALSACQNEDSQLQALQNQLTQANAQIATLQNQLDEAKIYKPEEFVDWIENESVWRTVSAGGFNGGAEFAPDEQDIEIILHYASLAPTSGGKTDYFLIAVTDPVEQAAIIGADKGITSDGTITILVLSDRLYDAAIRADGGSVVCQPDRAYYDAGIISGYVNTAAMALGYGTHYYMTVALPKDNGQFDSGSVGYDVSKYSEGFQYVNGNTGETVNVCGNCKFVCAIVIGTADAQAQSGVTNHEYPENWAIWQPPQEVSTQND